MIPETIRGRALAPALLCLVSAFFALVGAQDQVAEVPYLTGRITDNAEILSPEVRAHLTEVIKAHEEAYNDQIAVLTVPSLEGVKLEEFAAQVLRSWKLGERGKDNGVLLLVSPSDRRIRIEVGSGLKGKLSDVSANRIIRDLMTPPFQQEDINRGIDAGVHAIVAQLEGNEPQEAIARVQEEEGQKDSFFEGPDLTIPERILIGSFVFGIIGLFTIIGVMTPGVGWFLYLFLIPFWAMFPLVVVGVRGALILLITYLVGYPLAKLALAHGNWYRRAAADLKSKGIAQIGGFTIRRGAAARSPWSSS